MQASNTLLRAFSENRQSFGIWQMIPDANVSRLLARSGCEWIMIDCEHGYISDTGMHHTVPAVAAAGASPIVRLPDMQPWMIKRALDAGAHGILVPQLRTVEEARQVVKCAKFPPRGTRGYGSPIPLDRFTPVPTLTEYLQQANDALLTMVHIETQEALDAVDEIAAVDGIDVVFIGISDLANNIGHPIIDGAVSEELKVAIAKILEAGHRAGKKVGIYCSTGEQGKAAADQGFDMISMSSDYTLLHGIVSQEISIASGRLPHRLRR
ncbi:hypothetical protein VHEMI07610 [[Torrubiella] hemipterigena]|uniref:HpcH/HpaI aldolase/citrate lyase domain-containing protein n=1 Tax=[Torrubiella] hemipterigena TaxID=1531966 RepID=A0A0A1TLY6_9HYPO|nr:hypothetical protein VHEMI07610 [[Torrubiella] hemipterigena]